MKKFVLLCAVLAALCSMAYAEYQVNAPGYDAAKERYYVLMDKVVNGSATYSENVELSDLCQVYGLDLPVIEPADERGGDNLDQGSTDTLGGCASATGIPGCPYSDSGVLDGDNDCSVISAAPYNEVFYTFTPTVTGAYQMRLRLYMAATSPVPGIRVVSGGCCLGAVSLPNWTYSGSSVAGTECGEPTTVVTYLYVYLNAGTQYWIHTGSSTSTLGLVNAYDFNIWCWTCPTMEPPVLHNSCETAWEIACGDSIMGDSAISTNVDWYKVVVPDYSPLLCSLRVFIGGRELGHCISGKYPAYTSAPLGAVDARGSIFREQDGNPCVLDSLRKIDDEGCSYDSKGAVLASPGTYYIKVWNFGVNDYVMTTQCFAFDPIAACCFIDGSCQNLVAAECALNGGWSKPIGVLCDPNPCPPTTCPGNLLDDENVNNTCSDLVPEVVCDGWYCGVIPAASDTDWYKFVVPEGVCETLWVDIYGNDTPSQWPFGQGFDPYVELYNGDCITRLGYNYDNNGVDPLPVLDDSRLKYTIKTPGTYYIKIRSEYALTGPYLMHILCTPFECPVPPPNDLCDNAVVVAIPSATPGTTAEASLDTPPFCAYTPTSGGVWYKVTGTGYMLTADVCVSSFDTRMNVYSGDCANLVCVGGDDDLCSTPNSMGSIYTWCAQFGVDYYILIHGYSANFGTFTLNIVQGADCGQGACCDPATGGCSLATQTDCQTQGGVFQGYGTDCDPNPCPLPCLWPNHDDELINNTCGEPSIQVACGDTLCGNIATQADVDWYKIIIPTGVCDTLVIKIFADDTPGLPPFGQGLDSKVELFASDCITSLGSNDDNYGTFPEPVNYDSKLKKGCLEAGTYYIKVFTPYSMTGTGMYAMVVECISCACPVNCETFVLCGAPAEDDLQNNICPPVATQPEITCNTTVYGLHCPSIDTDFWKVTVAPMSVMTIKVFTGAACDVNPAVGVLFRYYDDLCASPTSGVATSVVISNLTAAPVVKYLEVYDTGTSQALYKVEATCCAVTDYCANPIPIHDGVYDFTQTVNTCCATNAVSGVWDDACTGTLYGAGPSVIWGFTLSTAGIVTMTAHSLSSQDIQIMVFTSCLSPTTTCVASSDGYGDEVLSNISLPAGHYFVSVSVYDSYAPFDACGEINLHIVSDVPLPVNLLGDVVATPGNEKVTLSWTTASETNNARFEILRDAHVIGHLEGAGTNTTRKSYVWSEEGLNNNRTYTYTLQSVDINENVNVLATVDATPSFAAGEVSEYALHQNYPNPFNPVTSIAFDLLESGNVTLKIFNLMGQEVKTVVNGVMPKGRQIVTFDAANLSSGIYLYRIEVNGFAAEKKMLLMK